MARSIRELLEAQAAGDPLSPDEAIALEQYEVELARRSAKLAPYASERLEDFRERILHALDSAESREELREIAEALLAGLEIFSGFADRAAGQHRRKQRTTSTGGRRRAEIRREERAELLAAIREVKANNPALTDSAAARRHLREASPDWWATATDEERGRRIAAVTRRVRRERQHHKPKERKSGQ